MNEVQRILNAVNNNHGAMYLATVVDVAGSSYRRPGARMLILPDGNHIGTISGGCLERDLCRQAPRLCKDGPKLVTFDTRDDSPDAGRRYNLGCNGIIYVLVEPITRDSGCPFHHLQKAVLLNHPFVVGTIYHTTRPVQFPVGTRLTRADLISRQMPEDLVDAYDEAARTGGSICCQVLLDHDDDDEHSNGEVRLFVECLSPPKPIWIFGSGDDAIPLARFAAELGWYVTVIDDQASEVTQERFPDASCHFVPFDRLEQMLRPVPNTAAIVMTHSLKKDAMAIRWLCAKSFNYIGLLGPKTRTGKLMTRIHATGDLPDGDALTRLRTPVGLDIGASTPAEIAISICAEIIAADNRRDGGQLRDRQHPIHEPAAHRLISAAFQPNEQQPEEHDV